MPDDLTSTHECAVFLDPDHPDHVVGRVGLGGTFYYAVPSNLVERQALGGFLDLFAERCRAQLTWFGSPIRQKGAFKAVAPHRAPPSYERLFAVDPARGVACAVGSGGTPDEGWDSQAGTHQCHIYSPPAYVHYDELGVVEFHVPLEAGAAELLELVKALCTATKPLYGSAGLVVGYPVDYRFALRAADAGVFSACLHDFPGIDGLLSQTLRQGPADKEKVPAVNWLTALNDDTVSRLEGELPGPQGEVALCPYEGGIIIQAGPRPLPCGAGRGTLPEAYRQVVSHLAPQMLATLDHPFRDGALD